ncbi:MAG TPA: hypothetical protein VGN64_15865 [Dyadobacter sp.]|jgi:hypothetical protein|nr:hypothetical protein [Dyadobacter sp.]
MIEVFKTNVADSCEARLLMEVLKLHFHMMKVSFDLEDCDKVLRVQSESGMISAVTIIGLLRGLGYCAEVLPDEEPTAVQLMLHETKFYPVC